MTKSYYNTSTSIVVTQSKADIQEFKKRASSSFRISPFEFAAVARLVSLQACSVDETRVTKRTRCIC